MQKTVLTKAVAVALATLGAGAAFAQSSVTIYGNLDVALDSAHKGQGDVNGTFFSLSPTSAAALSAPSTVTRVTSSISSVNALGFKGTEDIGGGYKASFVLEGQFQLDTGAQSGQDGRMWGRQAYVGLTTPVGEVRLGRQYAPMFYNFGFLTVEALGAADIEGSGLVVNNLQVRQDNQISYWLKAGNLMGALSYSPQAGVDQKVSSARVTTGNYTSTSGEIIGGAGSGATSEAAGSGGRGQSYGLLLNYTVLPELLVSGSYHGNKFGDAQLQTSSGFFLFDLNKYAGYALGAKYTVPGLGTQLSGIFHTGKYTMDDGENIKINTFALGAKHPIDNFAVGAQFAYSKFTNFTKGKDTAFMLIGDYNFSKRTKLYLRAGFVKDQRGDVVDTDNPSLTASGGAGISGGPGPLFTSLGSLETPFFSAAGANVDATTRVVAIGIRHQF